MAYPSVLYEDFNLTITDNFNNQMKALSYDTAPNGENYLSYITLNMEGIFPVDGITSFTLNSPVYTSPLDPIHTGGQVNIVFENIVSYSVDDKRLLLAIVTSTPPTRNFV